MSKFMTLRIHKGYDLTNAREMEDILFIDPNMIESVHKYVVEFSNSALSIVRTSSGDYHNVIGEPIDIAEQIQAYIKVHELE